MWLEDSHLWEARFGDRHKLQYKRGATPSPVCVGLWCSVAVVRMPCIYMQMDVGSRQQAVNRG